MNGHNLIAPIYDLLAQLIFGKRIERASKILVNWIGREKNILILGGGTGKVLEFFDPSHQIHYLDISQKMIELAQKRKFSCHVRFECEDFRSLNLENKYDAILCPFFLDVFAADELECVLEKLHQHSNPNTILLVADFDPRTSSSRNKIIMKAMLLFFYSLKAIPNHKYNNLFELIESQKKLRLLSTKSQQQGFIVSCKYKFISPT